MFCSWELELGLPEQVNSKGRFVSKFLYNFQSKLRETGNKNNINRPLRNRSNRECTDIVRRYNKARDCGPNFSEI
jgi:hypothetical protein